MSLCIHLCVYLCISCLQYIHVFLTHAHRDICIILTYNTILSPSSFIINSYTLYTYTGGSDRQLYAAGHGPHGVRGRVHPHRMGRAAASTYLTHIYTIYTPIDNAAHICVHATYVLYCLRIYTIHMRCHISYSMINVFFLNSIYYRV